VTGGLFADLPTKIRGLEFKSVMRTAALVVVASAGLVAGAVYSLLRWAGQVPDSTLLTAGSQITLSIAFISIFLLLSARFTNRPDSIVEVFWTPVIAGVSLLVVGYFVSRFGQNEAVARFVGTESVGFDLNTGRPLALASVFKMNVLSLLEAIFCFLLILRLKNLAMIKRTVASQRSWNWMIAAMVIAAATTFMKPPRYELNLYQSIALIPAIGMMAVNAFRTAWIVSLSFRQKLIVIGLSVAILGILLSIGVMEEALAIPNRLMPGNYMLLRHYSYPLAIFSNLSIVFGIIYCSTTILTVLFHLPTTSAYQQKVHEVAAIHSLTDLVGQVFDQKALFDTIVAAPVTAGLADSAWLTLSGRSRDSGVPEVVSTHRISAARIDRLIDVGALVSEAGESGEPLLIAHAPADHRVSARPGEGIGSIVTIPLSARGETLGALFATKEVSRGFEPEDIEALRVYGDQAALALDHAHLFEERVEKERLARELDIAREVQTKLLPQRIPELPGMLISAGSVAALEVGGDYYDFMLLGDDRLAFIIADVSGKGTSAAFYMAAMQGIFKALSRVSAGPRDFLIAANGALSCLLERNIFVSVIYGIIDSRAETITVARAGHCPPAVSTLSGDATYWRLSGLGLGLDIKGELFAGTISEETRPLCPGDVFVFYTDGVTESRHVNGTEYGYERLLEFVRKNRHEEADGLRALLLADLNEFVDYGSYGDDTTIVVVKWHGNRIAVDVAASAATASAAEPRYGA
jgi:serine phosphatase RsbU (regulator of sigma subunit)